MEKIQPILLCAKRNKGVTPEGNKCMSKRCIAKGCDGVFKARPLFTCFEDLEKKLEAKAEERERMANMKPLQLALVI